jgi:hypothetical protein
MLSADIEQAKIAVLQPPEIDLEIILVGIDGAKSGAMLTEQGVKPEFAKSTDIHGPERRSKWLECR